jgi:glycosyltransferase involved in cell wall biosynthesis
VDSPIVSIVTPSLNSGQFLEQAIRSVIDQDYGLIEYIVMDGGSVDNSVEVIQRHDSEIAFWISEPDAGQSEAINRGWQKSTGDILAWLNADDAYIAGAISQVVRAFRNNPKVDIVTADCTLIDESNQYIKDLPSSNFRIGALLTGNSFPQPGVFCRRSWIENVGWLEDNLNYIFDWALWLKLWLNGATFMHWPTTVARFRIRKSSKTGLASIGRGLSGGIPFARERCGVLEDILFEKSPRSWSEQRPLLIRAWVSTLLELALLHFLAGDLAQSDKYMVEFGESGGQYGIISPYHESVANHLAYTRGGANGRLEEFIHFLKPYNIKQLSDRWFRTLRSEILLIQAWDASQRHDVATAAHLFRMANRQNPALLLQRRVLSPTIKHLLRTTITRPKWTLIQGDGNSSN